MHARAVDHGVEVLEESTTLGTELAIFVKFFVQSKACSSGIW